MLGQLNHVKTSEKIRTKKVLRHFVVIMHRKTSSIHNSGRNFDSSGALEPQILPLEIILPRIENQSLQSLYSSFQSFLCIALKSRMKMWVNSHVAVKKLEICFQQTIIISFLFSGQKSNCSEFVK